MGDEKEGFTMAKEIGFEPGDGIEVQMVGGFVEEDHIG